MTGGKSSAFNLGQVMDGGWIIPYFQPLISVRKKSIVGYEGLIRGTDPVSGDLIDPRNLFHAAAAAGMTLELDRLCRGKVLEHYRRISMEKPDCLLSLNFEASVIDKGVVGSGHLIHSVVAAGLKPECISLEIIESNVRDTGELEKFIQTYRDYGFLIALDDVGAGHSNLNRIPLLKPDILKIDRYLIHNISGDFHKQEIFKSLVGLAHKIGSLILAEGVETEEEALWVMDLGVDLVQGFYFSKPQRWDLIDDRMPDQRMEDLSERFKGAVLEKLNIKRFNLRKYELMTREIQTELSKVGAGEFDRKLSEMAHYFPVVECLYVLDERGFQASETVLGNMESPTKNRFMFRPSPKGADHTLKDYFYMMVDGGFRKTTFISEPYLSLATGHSCVTFARIFRDAGDQVHILCVDINTQYLRQISL
jgi:EAL domain-containing protein (putative c-di-GMP-specific phosphodiesterase class I)